MKSLFLVACVLVIAMVHAASCSYSYSYGNIAVTYDLSQLAKQTGYYIYQDVVQDNSRNKTFYFNICNNIDELPASNCETTQYDASTTTSDPSPVFIIDHKNNETCSRGSGSMDDTRNINWMLLDYDNIGAGVIMMYRNGDYCPGSSWANHRTIYFYFECRETTKALEDTIVYETYGTTCFDIFQMSTPYACPQSCPHTATSICSSHGICLFDSISNGARCFCNSGYGGDDCGSRVFVGLSASAIFYILNSVALIVVVGTIGYMWNKLRKLRVDPDADVSLEATFNQLGQYAL